MSRSVAIVITVLSSLILISAFLLVHIFLSQETKPNPARPAPQTLPRSPASEPVAPPLQAAQEEPEPLDFDLREASLTTCWPAEWLGLDNLAIYPVLAQNQKPRGGEIRLNRRRPEMKAGIFEVEVNSPEVPVLLLLSNYHSTLWQISWTPGTEIVGAAVSGYENQAVAGLPEGVPIIHSSYEGTNSNCRFDRVGGNADGMSQFVQRTFNRPSKVPVGIKDGRALVGAPIPPGTGLISRGDLRPEKYGAFWDVESALARETAQGRLRPASRQDIKQWREARSLGGHLKITYPPVISTEDVFVLASPDFSIPEELVRSGPRSETERIFTFIIPPSWSPPEGVLSDVRLYFLEDGRCLGPGCQEGRAVYQAVPGVGPRTSPTAMKLSPDCRFENLELPEGTAIYAGGAYHGLKSKSERPPARLDYNRYHAGPWGSRSDDNQRPDANEGRMIVRVEDPGRSVALILGCYEPTAWEIQLGPDTELAAVVLAGYHRQRIINLPESVPLVSGSYDDHRCWSMYYSNKAEQLANINQLSFSLFGRVPDKGFSPREEGRLYINPLAPSPGPDPSWARPMSPPYGQFLRRALADGLIRPAAPETVQAWLSKYVQRLGVENLADERTGFEYLRPGSLYEVISNDFQPPPEGMVGGDSADFLLPPGFDVPEGNLGHATFFILEDGTCVGSAPGCRSTWRPSR